MALAQGSYRRAMAMGGAWVSFHEELVGEYVILAIVFAYDKESCCWLGNGDHAHARWL